MFSIRARTLSGLSSFLIRSFGFSGSRCPSAHWPSPRAFRGRAVGPAGLLLGAMSAVLRVFVGAARRSTAARRPAHRGRLGRGSRVPGVHRCRVGADGSDPWVPSHPVRELMVSLWYLGEVD